MGGAAGAYAWVFALAADESEYQSLAATEMERLGLYIAEIEHLDRFDPQEADSDEAASCLERLSDRFPVQYHYFHTYPPDEG